jgi:hypothetical protein
MSTDRSRLGFKNEAKSALGWLLQHGFRCTETSDLRVRWESSKVSIEIGHDERDYEVYVSFGRLREKEHFSFRMFLCKFNPSLDKSLGDGMVDTPETVAATVRALARALQIEGQGIIRGDDELFEVMKGVFWWHFHPEMLDTSDEQSKSDPL